MANYPACKELRCLLYSEYNRVCGHNLQPRVQCRPTGLMVNVLNFEHFSLSVLVVFRAGIHKMLVRTINSEEPDDTAFLRSSLFWFCAVCLGLFGRQLVFEILEHSL